MIRVHLMTKGLAVSLTILDVIVLSGCNANQNVWYEERCLKAGNAKGSQAYEACVARDREWTEQTARRASSTKARGR